MPLNQKRQLEQWRSRTGRLVFIFIFAFIVVSLRLWHLQILSGSEYRALSKNNHLGIESVSACRGFIYDRHGTLIAKNNAYFNLFLYPHLMKNSQRYAAFLIDILKRPKEQLFLYLEKVKQTYPLRPLLIKKALSWEEIAYIEGHHFEFPALVIKIEPMRVYHHLAAHLIGYISEISKEQLKERVFSNAMGGDLVGQYGIERAYQDILSGIKGERFLEIDAFGRELRLLKEIMPVPGYNLYLTIDVRLQKYVEELLEKKTGAIIVLDPNTGQVLAMASTPAFDQNLFTKGIDTQTWLKLKNDSSRPFQNRVTTGLYPPGSVFKVITAIAGLEEGAVSPYTKNYCSGEFKFGNRIFRCWKEKGHGWLNVKGALIQSCDVFFYKLGKKLGIECLARYAKACGFGQATGIEINEAKGLVPTPARKWAIWKRPWQKGETLNVAIGQGPLLTTPLQIAMFFTALCNGGIMYKPQILLKAEDRSGKVIKEVKPIVKGNLPFHKHTLDIIIEALAGVMKSPLGTGYSSRSTKIPIAGKTGTAQIVSLPQEGVELPYFYRDHAWFAGFAPVDNPEIVVVALIEHGGRASSTSAPIAKRIIEFFLTNSILDTRYSMPETRIEHRETRIE